MALGRLDPLQERVLGALGGFDPAFTLTGGAALAGFHTRHRPTRDLDLFWRGRDALGAIPRRVLDRLREAGLDAAVLQQSPAFVRVEVRDAAALCLLDLVAEPGAPVEAPTPRALGGVTLAVDTPRAILAEKLCTLLGRAELRDLEDVRALLAAGGDLEQALVDAGTRDGGFSPLLLAWVLEGLDTRVAARALGRSEADAEELDRFRERLREEVLARAAPPPAT